MGADEGVEFQDLLNQAYPVFPKRLRRDLRLHPAWDSLALLPIAQSARGCVCVVAAVGTNARLHAIVNVDPPDGRAFQPVACPRRGRGRQVGFLLLAPKNRKKSPVTAPVRAVSRPCAYSPG